MSVAIRLNDSIPVIYSGKVLEELEKAQVYAHVARKDFEGELSVGDRIIIRGYGDPSVGTYNGSNITWENIVDSAIQLDITEANYTAIKIEDIDKFQSDIEYMNRMAKKSAYKLSDLVDTTLAGLYSESAHDAVVTDASVDVDTVISGLTEMHTAMAEENIPESDMWVIVPWWVKDKLQLAGIYHANKVAGELVNGFIGNILGMNMYVSNNVSGSKGSSEYIMAGSTDAIALVQQIKKSDYFDKFENTFGSGMKTLVVWGYKVVKPKELFYADFTYTAETSI